jgi:hypothetical protein
MCAPVLQIVVVLCCAAVAIVLGLLCCISRSCGHSSGPKVGYGRDVDPRVAQRSAAVAAANGTAANGGVHPRQYARHGVVYDEGRGQFVVNGQPYGAYQFDADRGYYPTRGL